MTQKEFDSLPLLLRPWQAREVLGVDRRQLRKWRVANPAVATQLVGEQEWKFFKHAVAGAARVEYR